jgi:ABC-type transport system involved in multi-copper enzyme maturation permease subunit
LSRLLAIAAVTLREVLRRKVQVNLILFGAVLIVASFLVSGLTIGEGHRILSDLGLTAMQLIGLLVAVFLGASLISGDIERRVLQPVVAKPVSRTQYVLGRYLGLAAALVLNLVVMGVVLAAVLCSESRSLRPLDLPLLAAFGLLAVQFLVVGAVAILFSAISSTTLAAIFALAVAIAGQLTGEVRALWQGSATWIPRLLWYVLPNLGALNGNEAVIYRTLPPPQAGLAVVHGIVYAAATLALATLAFERRDLR